MDSFTQIVLGAAVADVLLGKKLGNRAMLYGAVVATLPDLDMFIGKLYDPISALMVHRGFSHSIVFFLMASPLLGWLVARLEYQKVPDWREAGRMVFYCLFTHALLDAFTTWGTQLLWPLPWRVALQSIFVIDPLYTLPFVYCVIRAMRLGRSDSRRRLWVRRGLVISSAYLLLTLAVKSVVWYRFTDDLDQKSIAYKSLSTKPTPFNIVLWNATVATDRGYLLADYSVFDTAPIQWKEYKHGREQLGQLAQSAVVRQLITISEGCYVITRKDESLFFNDLRFGLFNQNPDKPEFVFSYALQEHNGLVTATEVPNRTAGRGKALLKRLWERITS